MMRQGADGACIKLQNFNTSKGDLEGAYLNGVSEDFYKKIAPKDFLTL